MATLLSCRRRDHCLGCLPLPAHCSVLPASHWQHPSCSNACDSAHAFTPRPSPNNKLSPPVNTVGTLWVPVPASHRTCPCTPGGRLCIPVCYTLRISAIAASGGGVAVAVSVLVLHLPVPHPPLRWHCFPHPSSCAAPDAGSLDGRCCIAVCYALRTSAIVLSGAAPVLAPQPPAPPQKHSNPAGNQWISLSPALLAAPIWRFRIRQHFGVTALHPPAVTWQRMHHDKLLPQVYGTVNCPTRATMADNGNEPAAPTSNTF
ncbi:hypothetical protein B0H14DRAFT_2585202 [Mycena olivaceomarginata]|nr:hypothetical protein B0H14DRAFT_2585202 [Mycena olivaceomarginata]